MIRSRLSLGLGSVGMNGSGMYFNHRSFLKALRLSLLTRPWSLRRGLYVFGFTLMYLAFVAAVRVARWLDGRIWPGISEVPIKAPVFIIAPPRSGTSFLQKLLCADQERFIYWKMYQTIFPSVLFERCVQILRRADRGLGHPIGWMMDSIQRFCFGKWDNLHTMRLNAPEEDGALYLYAFACEAIYMLFPFIDDLWELGFPDTLPEKERKQLMDYYRSCLQRLIFSSGSGNTLLIKSTNSSGAVASILEAFPDARFITILRDPGDSIASSISLMMPALKAHSPEIATDGKVPRAYAKLSVEWYKYLHDFMGRIPKDRVCTVAYADLVADPSATIESVYHHFGWKMDGGYASRLKGFANDQKSYRSSHRYSLEAFGVPRSWLYEELRDVIFANRRAFASTILPDSLSKKASRHGNIDKPAGQHQ